MSEFFITSPDFEEGGEIPKNFGYKHGNERPQLKFNKSKDLNGSIEIKKFIRFKVGEGI